MDADLALIQQILADSKTGRLILPSPPDWVQKVNSAIQGEQRDCTYIARLIQLDPALAARIIQVANSPLYRGARAITEVRTALMRMGLRTARNLIYVFALKQGFQPKSLLLRQRMEQLWSHSRRVAAISSVLARHAHGMDPNRALLAGLVHDIGIFPILQYVDRHAEIWRDAARLDHIILRLRSPLGSFVLKQWQFDAELAAIPREAENWLRDPGPRSDYADLVLVAHAHSSFGGRQRYDGPPLLELPAFRKLMLAGSGPEASLQLLEDAQLEIDTVMALL
jgi:HD-like signal output (HDOD) protein